MQETKYVQCSVCGKMISNGSPKQLAQRMKVHKLGDNHQFWKNYKRNTSNPET